MPPLTHPEGRVLVIGANHRTSGLSVRDRLFVDDADIPEVLTQLRALGLQDAVVLSTCDRVEVHGFCRSPSQIYGPVRALFSNRAHIGPELPEDAFYLHQGADAVHHIFAVAASLDSLVVGEPQVLGQLKAAHRMARDHGSCAGPLENVLQSAYRAAKRVRTETTIGERPVSIAASACEVARDLHGDLSRTFVALIGAGEMGELIARHFQAAGVKGLTVSHPEAARADPLSRQLDCHVVAFENLSNALTQADIIISALGQRRHSLTADMVHSALKSRRNRPQLIIDTAVPGDVEPAVNRIDDAFLYELADLDRVAQDGQANRQAQADIAHRLIVEEVAGYLSNHSARDAVSVVTQLRSHFESVRKTVLAESPEDAGRATELLIARLLHNPSQFLRRRAREGRGKTDRAEQLLNALFDLDGSTRLNDKDKEK